MHSRAVYSTTGLHISSVGSSKMFLLKEEMGTPQIDNLTEIWGTLCRYNLKFCLVRHLVYCESPLWHRRLIIVPKLCRESLLPNCKWRWNTVVAMGGRFIFIWNFLVPGFLNLRVRSFQVTGTVFSCRLVASRNNQIVNGKPICSWNIPLKMGD